MRIIVLSIQIYFFISLVILLLSMFDLPVYLYMLTVLLLPIKLLGNLFEVMMITLGLWDSAGVGGWVNYTGPTLTGLIVIAALGLFISSIILWYLKRKI